MMGLTTIEMDQKVQARLNLQWAKNSLIFIISARGESTNEGQIVIFQEKLYFVLT